MKKLSFFDDPRRLWKAQLVAVLLTLLWVTAANWQTITGGEVADVPERDAAGTAAVEAGSPAVLPPETDPEGIAPIPAPAVPRATVAAPERAQSGAAVEDTHAEEMPAVDAGTLTDAPVYYDAPLSRDLQDYIRVLCEEYAVPMPLVLAIVEVESDFDPDCVSNTNDYGLMQINRCNFAECRKRFGEVDFLDPCDNLRCGVWLFAREYHAEDGDTVRALMRYNHGPTGARRKWSQGITETAYTRKVVAAMGKWEAAKRPTTRKSKQ